MRKVTGTYLTESGARREIYEVNKCYHKGDDN